MITDPEFDGRYGEGVVVLYFPTKLCNNISQFSIFIVDIASSGCDSLFVTILLLPWYFIK